MVHHKTTYKLRLKAIFCCLWCLHVHENSLGCHQSNQSEKQARAHSFFQEECTNYINAPNFKSLIRLCTLDFCGLAFFP